MLKKNEIINLEGHPNYITGSRVTAILLNGWILPMEVAVEGLQSTRLPRLVFKLKVSHYILHVNCVKILSRTKQCKHNV